MYRSTMILLYCICTFFYAAKASPTTTTSLITNSSNYIINGRFPTRITRYPFVAAIGFETRKKNFNYLDIGVIVDQWHVLTSRHGLTKNINHCYVVVGLTNINNVTDEERVPIEKIIVPIDTNVDMMIIKLKNKLDYTDNVTAIDGLIPRNNHWNQVRMDLLMYDMDDRNGILGVTRILLLNGENDYYYHALPNREFSICKRHWGGLAVLKTDNGGYYVYGLIYHKATTFFSTCTIPTLIKISKIDIIWLPKVVKGLVTSI